MPMKSRPALCLFLALLLLSTIAVADSPRTPAAVTKLINACIASAQANADNAYRYNFSEDWQTVSNDTNHASPITHSFQYDVTFIDTYPFRRKVGIDGYPLTAESAAIEQARYDREFTRIRALSPEQRIQALADRNALIFDPAQLATHYACRFNGSGKIAGEDNTIIECTLLPETIVAPPPPPRTKYKRYAPLPEEKTTLPKSITFWVDRQHNFFHRTRMVLSSDMGDYGKDSIVTNDWSLIKDVWHQTSTRIEYNGTREHSGTGIIVDTYSNFRKFTSEVTFMPGTKVAPPAAPGIAIPSSAPPLH